MDRIIIVDISDRNLPSFQKLGFQVHQGRVQDIIKDKLEPEHFERPYYFVSPANSLGFMDGGIDLAYMHMFPDIQKRVQQSIRTNSPYTSYLGRKFIPVGSAITVPAINDHLLISAPTMYLPHPVPITDNVYWTMKAVLKVWPGYGTLIIPPLACGIGMVAPDNAAEQMKKALDEDEYFMGGPNYFFTSPEITSKQPRYYENTEFIDIRHEDIVKVPKML